MAAEQKPARFSHAKPVSNATMKSFHAKMYGDALACRALSCGTDETGVYVGNVVLAAGCWTRRL